MNSRATASTLFIAWSSIVSAAQPAQTAVPPVGAAGPPSTSVTCTLRGVAEPHANAGIEDAQGHVVARFSGAPTALVATDFPSDAHGRARIETGTGAGGFRIRGFMAVSQLPLRAALNVVVVPGHVWIAAGRELTFVAAAPGRLRVERAISAPLAQTFSAWAPCNVLTLAPVTPNSYSPPGDARALALKKASLELFDQPTGSAVFTLTRAPGIDSVLFFSSERRGDWVSVSYHGDVIVDAWARARDFTALAAGETMDQLPARPVLHSTPRMAVQGEPRVVKPVREVPLRANPRESDASIGVVEPGAETYVLDVVAGWASVMPKSLNVVPGPDGQFWVRASDLGI
jgi:hypothetical protein